MDGVINVVEKMAMEEGDEDEAAVAAIVSSRAATATQARRTEDDLSDHALDEERRLAIAGGGLAKAVILIESFFSLVSPRVIQKDSVSTHTHKKRKGTRLVPRILSKLGVVSPRDGRPAPASASSARK